MASDHGFMVHGHSTGRRLDRGRAYILTNLTESLRVAHEVRASQLSTFSKKRAEGDEDEDARVVVSCE